MKKYILIGALLLSGFLGFAQELDLVFQDTPLNEILLAVRDRYQLQFSFDHARLSAFPVTVNRKFSSPEKALDELLKKLPLTWEKAGGVYLIYDRVLPEPKKNYHLAGTVTDRETNESLPYTHLVVNGHGLITDQKGNFSYLSTVDSVFQVQVSCLGYYFLDTLVQARINQPLRLTPSVYKLLEIKVEGLKVVRSVQVGYSPGTVRLNHQIAGHLPGYGDNSVFNLLRLQSGILAAGEQSNDLIIWGSYEGQSQVLVDGFTLFGLKNYNDNISAINPFMVKDIQVMKGGFPAPFGERVGGLVNITSSDGDVNDLHVNLSVNNMTMNGLLNVPVAGKASLMVALRQTYYELYDKGQIALSSGGSRGNRNLVDRNIYPDYHFQDLNLKFTGKTNHNDSYSLSFLTGNDRFAYALEYETPQTNRIWDDRENNRQYGLSAHYNKGWKNGGRSELTLAYSDLQSELNNIRKTGNQQSGGSGGSGGQGPGSGGSGSGNTWQTNIDQFNQNKISETRWNLHNYLPLPARHQLEFGGGMYFNRIHFTEDSFEVNLTELKEETRRLNGFVQDRFSIGNRLQLITGIRTDYPLNLDRLYLQPRVAATVSLSDFLKVNAAGGLYRQYIARNSVIDEFGNVRYLWTICNGTSVPVLKSEHTTLGFTYHQHDFTFSIELYRKQTNGLSRYAEEGEDLILHQGRSKSKGLDLFIKKDYKGHSFWIAAMLGNTREHFSDFPDEQYQRALHDQRVELKSAALIHLEPFYLSANYVYGSGFPDPLLLGDENYERDYHRMDIAAVYRVPLKRLALEAGISVLNVFNYENIKYANFIRIPDDQDATVNLHAEAVPFTPTMFLNLSF
ncbi:TonB-dependent receptor plug domain-containing protein [Gaoshiqia sp. Z1-71]|uniref:TonB-dependent receptor plug domain-containing protein n=1 Tax=Gaoshiqia hydrogeniformans TaxID=3290090 RepID=UPI003BF81B8B